MYIAMSVSVNIPDTQVLLCRLIDLHTAGLMHSYTGSYSKYVILCIYIYILSMNRGVSHFCLQLEVYFYEFTKDDCIICLNGVL